MSDTLKNCPLCGGPARVYKNAPSSDITPWDHVVCINCGCGVNSVKQWNHRMADEEIQELERKIYKLEDKLEFG